MTQDVRAIVDASAVLAWVFGERGADTVEKVLSVSGISAVNFAEVLYIASNRRYDPDELEADLADYGLILLPFGGAESRAVLAVKEAEQRAGLFVSLADRCCLATAMTYGVPAVVSDNAWEQLDIDIDIQPFR